MKPVGKVVVDVLAFLRRHERRNNEIDVAEEEENDDGKGGANGRIPVPGLAVEVEVDEAQGNKCVDDGQGVRDEVENKVVSVTGRRREHDDD